MDQNATPAEQLAARGFQLQRDAFDRLILTDADGRKLVGVEPVRAFPISSPEEWLSIINAEGGEVLCIREIDKLPGEVRKILEEELSRREFVPIIECITSVSADVDPSEWRVETDRGETAFLLDSEDDVRRLGTYKALLIDTHGIRYLIPDTRRLDYASRRILDRYFSHVVKRSAGDALWRRWGIRSHLQVLHQLLRPDVRTGQEDRMVRRPCNIMVHRPVRVERLSRTA